MPYTLDHNSDRDTRHANRDDLLGRVLHIFDANWHGIRSATAALPGGKLAISHEDTPTDDYLHSILSLIEAEGYRHVCFQGYSETAHKIACHLKASLGAKVGLFAVSHVTSTQFENPFEVKMQELLLKGLKDGVFDRLGSVKPHFHDVVGGYHKATIINFCPVFERRDGQPCIPDSLIGFDEAAVFVPVEKSWRKNLYTNILAALGSERIDKIYSVNWPVELNRVADLDRVEVTGFLKGSKLYSFYQSVSCLLNVTLAECQPMTQLEAFALGVPCLTGPLRLPELEGDALMEICEVPLVDTPTAIRPVLENMLALRRSEPDTVRTLIQDHLENRRHIARQQYADFFSL